MNRFFTVLIAALVLMGLWAGTGRFRPADRASAVPTTFEQRTLDRLGEIDRLIAVFSARAADEGTAIDHRTLGGLYLERARITSSLSDYVGATDAYREAHRRAGDDPETLVGLASAQLALHDFREAERLAAVAGDLDPELLAPITIMGDAALARGDTEAAARAFELLADRAPDDPGTLVRMAELRFAQGDVAAAIDFADGALGRAIASLDGPDLAFYFTYRGRLAYLTGDYETSAENLTRAVRVAPGNPGSLADLARATAALGDIEQAADLYRAATDIAPDPTYLAGLGDALTALGRTAEAADAYATVEFIATLAAVNEQAYGRAFGYFLADHDIDAARAVAVAEAELEVRSDAGAHDLYAWALYRAGRIDEAMRAAARATRAGVAEPLFEFHAGVIADAAGEADLARRHLSRALELSPEFHVLFADEARRLLAEVQS